MTTTEAKISFTLKMGDGMLTTRGDDLNEFMNAMAAVYGDDVAGDIYQTFATRATPVSANYTASVSGPGLSSAEPRGGAGVPPGSTTVCPTHKEPAKWKEPGVSQSTGKPYTGFWKCPVTDKSISNFNGNGLKPACPS